MSFGPVLFTAPSVLLALLALPVLWLLLRAVPPAPLRQVFPAVVLLLGLKDEDSAADRTPWWLLLMRMLAVAAVILGLAGPVLNPGRADEARAPKLLIALDASWASARDWPMRMAYLDGLLTEAARDAQLVSVLRLSAPDAARFEAPSAVKARLVALKPEPWEPMDADALAEVLPEGAFDTVWLSDGLARESRDGLVELFEARGRLSVVEGAPGLTILGFGAGEGDGITLTAKRLFAGAAERVRAVALGPDPSGAERVLETADSTFDFGGTMAELHFSLPTEILSRVTRFELEGASHAGAVLLTDDRVKRRKVGLVGASGNREGLELLSPLHYLDKALVDYSEVLIGSIEELVPAQPDTVFLADIAELTAEDETTLTEWVEEGGLLIRFAGPRVAASEMSGQSAHPLMPVGLREGGRFVGGTMSWGAPKGLAPFEKGSPFFGLSIDPEIAVSAQVVAEPSPELSERTIARLNDGTPLVTRKALGQGQVVLFHISANAEWSNLPLSGLFVRMLERLSVARASQSLNVEELEGTVWVPERLINGFGKLYDAEGAQAVGGPRLVSAPASHEVPPGVYQGPGQVYAQNTLTADYAPKAAAWPQRLPLETLDGAQAVRLAGPLYGFALLLLVLDVLATLGLSGRLQLVAGLLAALLWGGVPAEAQQDAADVAAAAEIVLGHVLTGDARVDELAHAGLRGLSNTLYARTSVEPTAPRGVNLEEDELAFFPLLYWPVTPEQPIPSVHAVKKLNSYLRSGGMILFDTRDANVARFGASSPAGKALRRLAAGLDIPDLEPVPEDHVLTRSFYLLQDFPGRHLSRDVWVEAAQEGAERADGMPFRNLNDGVTPVVIGGNDWAAAWAVSEKGRPMLPVGRGFSGERQRELAYRFGVNLVMHVLTGNYKSDQVHVPALLERLGQ